MKRNTAGFVTFDLVTRPGIQGCHLRTHSRTDLLFSTSLLSAPLSAPLFTPPIDLFVPLISEHLFYAYVPVTVLCVLEDTEISNSTRWIQGLSTQETVKGLC